MRKYIKSLMLYANLLAVALLLASYLSVSIDPGDAWLFALLGMAMPLLLFINLLFILFWALLRKRIFFLSLITILIGWGFVTRFVQLDFAEEEVRQSDLKVLSYNVRLFDLYNWGKDWSFNNVNKNKILGFLAKEKADIICLQEIVSVDTGNFRTLDTLVLMQPAGNAHITYNTHNQIYHFGIATLTAHPIVQKGMVHFPKTHNLCIYTDIARGSDTVRVYNVHLESLRLARDDYKVAERGNDHRMEDMFSILQKMITAWVKRSEQVDLLTSHMKTCRYPVIVCGDFNDIPSSYAYQLISRELLDAFRESGQGFGHTYVGQLPSFRIDYIFHSPGLESKHFTVHAVDYSDHYPISCYISLPD